MHTNVSWSLLVLTLTLGKTGSSYAPDFLKDFWPLNKANYHVIWVLTYMEVLKTCLLSPEDKQMLMPFPYLLASLKCRSIGLVFKGIVFLSIHYCVNSLLFFLVSQSWDCQGWFDLVKCFKKYLQQVFQQCPKFYY